MTSPARRASPALASSPSSLSRAVSSARLSLSPSSPALVATPSRRGLYAPAQSEAELAKAESKARARVMVEQAREAMAASARIAAHLRPAQSPSQGAILLPTAAQMREANLRHLKRHRKHQGSPSKIGSLSPEQQLFASTPLVAETRVSRDLHNEVRPAGGGEAPASGTSRLNFTPLQGRSMARLTPPTSTMAMEPATPPARPPMSAHSQPDVGHDAGGVFSGTAEALPHGGPWRPGAAMRPSVLGGMRPVPSSEALPSIRREHLDATLSSLKTESILDDAHAIFTSADRDTNVRARIPINRVLLAALPAATSSSPSMEAQTSTMRGQERHTCSLMYSPGTLY